MTGSALACVANRFAGCGADGCTLVAHADALRALGLDGKDMVKVAANDGGARALRALIDQANALQSLGFDCSQMLSMAKVGGSAQVLATLTLHGHALLSLGFEKKQLRSVDKINAALSGFR